MRTLIVSIPEGRCSKQRPQFSIASSTRLPKPISAFIMSFSTLIIEKPFLPAIPVITESSYVSEDATIIVPGSDGSLVFLMFIGIPSRRTGKIASSWNTIAPMYESSRSSA